MVYNINTSAGSKLIYISSKNIPQEQFKNPSLNTSFTVQLTTPINAYDTEHILVSLYSASIPMSFYNLRASETKIKVGVIIDSVEYIETFTLDPGNYTIKQVYSSINNLLNTINAEISKYLIFELVGQLNKTKITLLNNTIGFTQIKFYFNESTISQILGFNNILYTLDINHYIIGPKMILLFDAFSIYLRTSLLSLNNYNEKGNFTDILERIPCVDPYKVVYFSPPASQHKLLLNQKAVATFDVSLTFDNNELVDLSGLDWEFSLKFDIVKDLDRGYNIDIRQNLEDDNINI
jgi:hypothetical protein